MNIKEAKSAVLKKFERAVRDGDGWPGEADSDLNDANRSLVHAVKAETGEAWLGEINGYRRPDWRPLWRWEGEAVLNFSCSFIVSQYDAELEKLLRERADVPADQWNSRDDYVRIERIFTRIDELGGHHLFWT
jgi:hypothetical protein